MTPADVVRLSFESLGITASFDPDGDAHQVRLIPSMGTDIAGFGDTEILGDGTLYEIQATDWETVKDVQIFDVDGVRRMVQGAPRAKDARQLVRVLDSLKI